MNKVRQTITIKINERSKAGIALQKILEILKTQPGVQIVEEERSPYNPEFVKKIKESEKQINEGKFKILSTEDIWGSLGLKREI
jgi:predicted RND superfamily exporter protein